MWRPVKKQEYARKRGFGRGPTDTYVVGRVTIIYYYDAIHDIWFRKANPLHERNNGGFVAKLSKVLSDLVINPIKPITMERIAYYSRGRSVGKKKK